MQSITQITLPQPCHELWANMNTVEKGRFCLSCNKTVVDFTTMTNQQIIDHLLAAAGNVCGRIGEPQLTMLNNQLATPAQPRQGIWKRLMLTATMLASLSYVKGQPAPAKPVTEQTPGHRTMLGSVTTLTLEELTAVPLIGRVTDEQGEPLAQVIVVAGKHSVATDNNGNFRLQMPASLKYFELRYIGFETATVKINKKPGKLYHIKMKTAAAIMGKIAVIKSFK